MGSAMLASFLTCVLFVGVLGKDNKKDEIAPPGFTNLDPFDLFTPVERHHIKSHTYKFLDNSVENIWETVHEVSDVHPFVFFNQRHAGGLSIRNSLGAAAQNLHLDAHIACVTTDCDNFDIPTDYPRSIYAQSLQWGEQNNFNRFRGEHHRTKFSCMTNFREPISRLINCVYAQFGEDLNEHNAVCLSDLDDATFTRIIARSVDDYGNSCLNEPFRIMSGMRDEAELDSVGIGSISESGELTMILKPIDMDVLQMTLTHMEKCVPIVHEIPKSVELLKLKFPQLYSHGGFVVATEDPDLGIPAAAAKCGSPTASQMEILQRFTAMEKILYDTVARQVEKALAGLQVGN